jgi:hypothetical protein
VFALLTTAERTASVDSHAESIEPTSGTIEKQEGA